METVLEKNKITIHKDDVTTTIRPTSETGILLTKTMTDIEEYGMPTNDELDQFGDQLWQAFEESKTNAKDDKSFKIAETSQKVVSSIQHAMEEKNYDEKLQEIVKKVKEQTPSTTEQVPELKKEFEEEGEKIISRLKEMMPLFTNLGKQILRDREFRDLIISLLDVIQCSYRRVEEGIEGGPSISEALREDIGDTERTKPEKTEKVIREKVRKAKKYMELTDEEREELQDKTAKALLKFRSHEDYHQLFDVMFKLYDDMVTIWSRVNEKPELRRSYEEGTSILRDIKVLIERSCNRSLDRWNDLIRELNKVRDDERYKKLRSDIEELILDRNHHYQNEEDIKDMYNDIKQQGDELNESYNNVLDDLFEETSDIINGITNDPVISTIRKELNNLIIQIFTDENGKPTVTAAASSLLKIKEMFFPIIKERIKNVSLPSIEVESSRYYYKIFNVNFNVIDILPEHIQIDNVSSVSIDMQTMKREGVFQFRLLLSPFTTDINNMRFVLKKKQGIKYNDHGELNIHLKDSSFQFSFRIQLEADRVDYISLDSVEVKLKGLKIKIVESRHDVLDKIATTVFLPVIRGKLQKLIEEKIYDAINSELCDRVNDALKNLDR